MRLFALMFALLVSGCDGGQEKGGNHNDLSSSTGDMAAAAHVKFTMKGVK